MDSENEHCLFTLAPGIGESTRLREIVKCSREVVRENAVEKKMGSLQNYPKSFGNFSKLDALRFSIMSTHKCNLQT